MEAKSNEYLTVEAVCEKLSISKGTVYNLFKRGLLKKTKITSDITRIKASELDKYLESKTQ